MDRQAAINTSHFSSRPCSHFHFDVIIISSPPIVTGLRASIYTHWLQGEKKRARFKSLVVPNDHRQTVRRFQTEGKSEVKSLVACVSVFPDLTVSFNMPQHSFVYF